MRLVRKIGVSSIKFVFSYDLMIEFSLFISIIVISWIEMLKLNCFGVMVW